MALESLHNSNLAYIYSLTDELNFYKNQEEIMKKEITNLKSEADNYK